MMRPARPHPRPGFTLVETLIVISIIIMLAAILIVALGRSGVKAKEEATAALIRKISNQVQERLEAFDRLKSQQQYRDQARNVAQFNGVDPGYSDAQLEIIGFKILQRQLFPQKFSDLTSTEFDEQFTSTTPQYPYSGSKHQAETESSELLYYALTRGKVLGIPTVDPGEYKDNEAKDTDGDGLLEFVDAWGRPLRFYRWPTRLIKPDGIDIERSAASILMSGLPAAASPDPLNQDQDDPTLQLLTVTEFTESSYHTPQTYHVFLVVSSGPDGQKTADADAAFGLYSPTQVDTAQFGYLCQPITGKLDALTDNITNRNR